MDPIARTLAFVVAAFLSLGAAGLTYWSHLPAKVDWSADIGQDFFPEFQDPNKATSLRVATFDKDASKTSEFSVESKNGKWLIPSHSDYPADGKDRLKNTAASVIGVKRGTLAGKSKAAHKEHHLLDPLDKDLNETEGRGDRITLKDGDKPLVDFIIGKKSSGPGNSYYIRRADEDRFYISQLKIELSTKFADWIEPDLLDLKKDEIKEITIDRYSVDEAQGVINPGVRSFLSRDSATADWAVKGIDTTTKKPKTSVINAMLGSFDDLKIVGVRPKPKGLSASLAGDDTIPLGSADRIDLQNRGFFYHPKRGLVSNEGDMIVSTFDGVSYVLRFGEVFTGTDIEVEAGSSPETAKKASADGKKEGEDAAPLDQPDSTSKKNRFVFITAQFDEAALGKPPVKPKEPKAPKEAPAATPEKPAGPQEADKPAEADKPEAKDGEKPAEEKPADKPADATKCEAEGDKPAAAKDEKAAEDAKDAAKPAEPKEGEKPAAPAADPAAEAAAAKATAKADHEKALQDYETASDVYRIRKKEFDDKKAAGEKKAKRLNARFAAWYYVISEDLFTELRVKPEDLVEPLVTEVPGHNPGLPKLPILPSTPKPDAPAEEDKPAEEAKKPEGDQPAEPKAGEAKEAVKKPVEGDKTAEPAKPAEGAQPAPPKANP